MAIYDAARLSVLLLTQPFHSDLERNAAIYKSASAWTLHFNNNSILKFSHLCLAVADVEEQEVALLPAAVRVRQPLNTIMMKCRRRRRCWGHRLGASICAVRLGHGDMPVHPLQIGSGL